MPILNIAGYKFIPLTELAALQAWLQEQCHALALKGTILLSHEGININLAGLAANIQSFQALLKRDRRFAEINFHESYSTELPFKHLKVKLKDEIISLRQPSVDACTKRAPDLSPAEFKHWLDEKRDMILLDTRNDYEVRFGTFNNALNLHIADFAELPECMDSIERDKPVVMFCTGGIRCEKAAIYMLNQGFSEIYQLDGGILGYFNKVGGSHYEGECFVFDERVAVDSRLQTTGSIQCLICQGPVTQTQQSSPDYVSGVSCPACINNH